MQCPYPYNGLPVPNVAPDYPLATWRGTPPPPPFSPNVPPPPPLPFNTNYKAMIGKFGGAIWNSVKHIFLPPLTEQEIVPLMHMDPLSGALALLIDPYEGCINTLPIIIKLTQPPQVPLIGNVH
jgi:hypothetical protein